ncbi:MAG: C4-dicarboxylate ABC transporter [Stutzerimonas stutzeri]|nr:MAG: C4-dicarboxylate ABC transporter [Stutzerimonas stutzeri]
MIADLLAPAMLVSLVVVLLVGFPVAFSLAAVAGAFGGLAIASGAFPPVFLTAMFFRILGMFNNDNLLAIPLLVLMGLILERTGIAEDMLMALNRLFRRLPGALAYAVIIVGAVLSPIVGFVSASVIALGLISMPVMMRAGYDARLSTGVVAASGTLAQVVPPSLVLIVLAEQLEVSLVDIYRGALLPSGILVAFYLVFVFVLTLWKPQLAPPILGEESSSKADWRFRAKLVLDGALPIGLVLCVLASIAFGVATPSEGGAIGVSAALLLAWAKKRLALDRLKQATMAAGVLCSGVIFLLIGASFFTLVFRGLNGQQMIEALFQYIPAGPTGFVVAVNAAVFGLAFFLDFFEIAFIVLPLIAPIAHKVGVDVIWLAVLLAINLQTSFMHPPFGIALYNLRSVTPTSIRTQQIYWGAVPFVRKRCSQATALSG